MDEMSNAPNANNGNTETYILSAPGRPRENSLKMKIVKWKSNSTVKNLAQAGDAFLAFYFEKKYPYSFSELEVNTQEACPTYNINLPEKQELLLWAGEYGFKKIPLLPTGFILDSLKAMNFTKKELREYSHFILKDIICTKFFIPTSIKIYHINDSDRNEFIAGF